MTFSELKPDLYLIFLLNNLSNSAKYALNKPDYLILKKQKSGEN